jgi:acyl CoA:acetate/3-ketoacid CoA transferase
MKPVPVLSARDAAELIGDNAVISISSSSALGCPDVALEGIGARFAGTGHPRSVHVYSPIAAGDMYGVAGIDHLAVPGLMERIVAGSYPSGPSSATPPAIWSMIEANQVQAYNLPSGVMYQMHRAGAAAQPGVFSQVGLDTFVDPRLGGGRMNDAAAEQIVAVADVAGQEWLSYPAVRPDVAVIRATTADENGNLTFEEEGSALGALDLAYAAHNSGGLVIAQVKRLAAAGSLPAQDVRVPGILIDVVVLAPGQLQTTMTAYDPALSGQLRQPVSSIEPVPWSLEKVIARRAAAELHDGDIVNLGFGVAALVPRILVEQGRADAVSWLLEQGAVGGVPLTGFAFGCSLNPSAIMSSADQFTLLQGGGFDHAMLSFLQIDREGNVNVHHLPGRRHVTAGVGGFADITSRAKSIVFIGAFNAGRRDIAVRDGALDIRADGSVAKVVDRVSAVTFSGRRARQQGQRVRYVTERCVLDLGDGGLVLTEIAPGADLNQDVLAQIPFEVAVAPDLTVMDAALFTEAPGAPARQPVPANGHSDRSGKARTA